MVQPIDPLIQAAESALTFESESVEIKLPNLIDQSTYLKRFVPCDGFTTDLYDQWISSEIDSRVTNKLPLENLCVCLKDKNCILGILVGHYRFSPISQTIDAFWSET